MPGIEDAVAEIKQIRADLDAIPAKIDMLQATFGIALRRGFQDISVQLIEIVQILSKHPEMEKVVKDITAEIE